jgi:hypothetical protein
LEFHISSYAYSRAQNALKTNSNRKIVAPNDDVAQEHFMILVDSPNNFIHYELSNFEKKIFSKNNSG